MVDEGVEVVVLRFLGVGRVIRDQLENVDSYHDQVLSTRGTERGSIHCSPFMCFATSTGKETIDAQANTRGIGLVMASPEETMKFPVQ